MAKGSLGQNIVPTFIGKAWLLLRHMKIWQKYQLLVQSIKKGIGSAAESDSTASVLATGSNDNVVTDQNARNEVQADCSSPRQNQRSPVPSRQPSVPALITQDSSSLSSDVPYVTAADKHGEDVLPLDDQTVANPETIKNIQKAMEDAHPTPRPQTNLNIREMYEGRVQRLDAAYSRLVPDLEAQPKQKADRPRWTGDKDASRGDYDNAAVEYVVSSLMVALPQSHQSGLETGTAFRPPVHDESDIGILDLDADPRSTGASAEYAASGSEIASSEPEVKALFANYSTWDHRKLYSGLRLDKSSIRLVDVLPGSPQDEVFVDMDVYPLHAVANEYDALSYVWGDPKPAKYIFVNKVQVPVNPSLYDALVSLRQRDSLRRIWIDAICLNQMSVAERSREVQKMGLIYNQARTVNVFLGAPSRSGTTLINNFILFLNRSDAGRAIEKYAKEGLRGLDETCHTCQTNVRDVSAGFVEACLQPWWGRIWTLVSDTFVALGQLVTQTSLCQFRGHSRLDSVPSTLLTADFQQEFYLAQQEPMWYWGSAHASNACLKRDFSMLEDSVRDLHNVETLQGAISNHSVTLTINVGSRKADFERTLALISRRRRTHGFENPKRLYRELTARAINPRDFVYGLRAIFDPVFGSVFVPDYQMRTELLFACLAVFLIQFECWGDVLWWYPPRYPIGTGLPSWLPDFTHHNVPHELDVQPLDQALEETPEPRLIVLNHRLYAEGYVLDKVYGHRHLDKSDGYKILQELWLFDHCINHNHEWDEDLVEGAEPEDSWLKAFLVMYKGYYATLPFASFVSAFKGAILHSTIKPEYTQKLPRQIAECMPCWDLIRWHALRTTVPGLHLALGHDIDSAGPGCLDDIFSPEMTKVFRKTVADFFIAACIFDWSHLSIWLRRFPDAEQWSKSTIGYWSQVHNSLPADMEKCVKAMTDAYESYADEIWPEVKTVSWCHSFYYTFLAYVILLDCDNHSSLETIILKLQTAGSSIRGNYFSNTSARIEELATTVPSIAKRLGHYEAVMNLFKGRSLLWTHGGFRGISCPGVEVCCDKMSVVAIIDGLSFPVVVRQYDEGTSEGRLAGFALIRGVNMLGKDAQEAALPLDYARGARRRFEFR